MFIDFSGRSEKEWNTVLDTKARPPPAQWSIIFLLHIGLFDPSPQGSMWSPPSLWSIMFLLNSGLLYPSCTVVYLIPPHSGLCDPLPHCSLLYPSCTVVFHILSAHWSIWSLPTVVIWSPLALWSIVSLLHSGLFDSLLNCGLSIISLLYCGLISPSCTLV